MKLSYHALFCAVLLTLLGCRRALVDQEPQVVKIWVAPDWSPHQPPPTARVIFYPEDPTKGGLLVDLPINPTGDSVALAVGSYRMVLFNTSAQNILFESTKDRDRVSALIFDPATRSSSQTIPAPDWLYAGSVDFQVQEAKQRVTTPMQLMTIVVNMRLRVADADQVKSVYSTLRNVSDGVWLARQEPFFSIQEHTYTTDMSYLGNSGEYYSFTSRTFGAATAVSENETAPKAYVDVRIDYNDQTQHSLSADITEALQQAKEAVEAEVSIDLTEVGGVAQITGWRIGPFVTGEID